MLRSILLLVVETLEIDVLGFQKRDFIRVIAYVWFNIFEGNTKFLQHSVVLVQGQRSMLCTRKKKLER